MTLVGTTSNRNAIGARVRLTAAGRTQVEEVRGGGSYYAQNDFRLHFGLGAAATIERVEVRWPNGLRGGLDESRCGPARHLHGRHGHADGGDARAMSLARPSRWARDPRRRAARRSRWWPSAPQHVATPSTIEQARAHIDAGRACRGTRDAANGADHGDPAVAAAARRRAVPRGRSSSPAIETLQPLVGRLGPDAAERQELEQVLGLSLFFAGRYADARAAARAHAAVGAGQRRAQPRARDQLRARAAAGRGARGVRSRLRRGRAHGSRVRPRGPDDGPVRDGGAGRRPS